MTSNGEKEPTLGERINARWERWNDDIDGFVREDRPWKEAWPWILVVVGGAGAVVFAVVHWSQAGFLVGSLAVALFIERLTTTQFRVTSILSTAVIFGGIAGLFLRGLNDGGFIFPCYFWIAYAVVWTILIFHWKKNMAEYKATNP